MRRAQERDERRFELRDGVALLGLGAIFGGLWFVDPRAAVVTVGAILFALAVWRA